MFQTTIVIIGNTKKNSPEILGQKKSTTYTTKRCLILQEGIEKLFRERRV